MWAGFVLSVWLLTANDMAIGYNTGHFNYKRDCNEAKEELIEKLNEDYAVKRFSVYCKESRQSYFIDRAILIQS